MSAGLFFRNLNRRGKDMIIQNRSIVPPDYGNVDFSHDFVGDEIIKGLVKTVSGKTYFDGVSVDEPITHEFRIPYIVGAYDDDTVTSDSWVLFKGRRIDMLRVMNCCEEDAVLVLVCVDRGKKVASRL